MARVSTAQWSVWYKNPVARPAVVTILDETQDLFFLLIPLCSLNALCLQRPQGNGVPLRMSPAGIQHPSTVRVSTSFCSTPHGVFLLLVVSNDPRCVAETISAARRSSYQQSVTQLAIWPPPLHKYISTGLFKVTTALPWAMNPLS